MFEIENDRQYFKGAEYSRPSDEVSPSSVILQSTIDVSQGGMRAT